MFKIAQKAKQFLSVARFSTSMSEANISKFSPFSSLYFERQSYFEDENEIELKNKALTLMPYYIDYLHKNFNEKTFSLCASIVLYEIKHNMKEETSALAHQYKDELFQILYKNINRLEKLNTITSSLKKILLLGYPLNDKVKGEFASKTIELIHRKDQKYNFTDQGSLATFAILTFLRIGYKDLKFFETYSQYIANNIKKVKSDKIIGGYFALSRIPLSMSPQTHQAFIEELKFRRKILGIDGAAKMIEGFADIANDVKSAGRWDEYAESFDNVLNLIADVINYEISLNRPLDLDLYFSFIYLVLRGTPIMRLYPEKSNAPKKLLNAFETFLDKKILKCDGLEPGIIQYLKNISEVLNLIHKYDLGKYFPRKLLITFIKSLIITINDKSQDISFIGNVEAIVKFLGDYKELIASEKINTAISSEAYERLVDVVFGDVDKLGLLKKSNK